MAVSEKKLRHFGSLLWTIFGLGLGISSWSKQEYAIAILGLLLGVFWAFKGLKTLRE